MSKIIDALLEVSGVTIIILSQQREYEYDYAQTSLLVELALCYKKINKDDRLSYSHIITNPQHERYIRGSYAIFQQLISKKLKEDPLAAYIELKRLERREKINYENIVDQRHAHSQQQFVQILQEIIHRLENLRIIASLLPHSKEYQVGTREIYGNIFHPTIKIKPMVASQSKITGN